MGESFKPGGVSAGAEVTANFVQFMTDLRKHRGGRPYSDKEELALRNFIAIFKIEDMPRELAVVFSSQFANEEVREALDEAGAQIERSTTVAVDVLSGTHDQAKKLIAAIDERAAKQRTEIVGFLEAARKESEKSAGISKAAAEKLLGEMVGIRTEMGEIAKKAETANEAVKKREGALDAETGRRDTAVGALIGGVVGAVNEGVGRTVNAALEHKIDGQVAKIEAAVATLDKAAKQAEAATRPWMRMLVHDLILVALSIGATWAFMALRP